MNSEKNELLERPILIGGSGSSGTTLLSSILDTHSEIVCGPEMSLFSKEAFYGDFAVVKRNIPKWLRWGLSAEGYAAQPKIIRARDEYKLSVELLENMILGADSFREFALHLAAHVTESNNKTRFAEKTPSNVYCFREFVEIFPEGRLIHVIRDGRDAVCSLMNRGFTVFESTSIWLYGTIAGIQHRNLPQYLEVRYEDLVSQPGETVRKICDHIGVDFQEQMIEDRRSSWGKPKEISSWGSSPNSKISSKSIGRYKRDMSKANYGYFMRTKLTKTAEEKLNTKAYTAAELLLQLGYIDSVTKLPQVSSAQARYLMMRDWAIRSLLSVSSRERFKPAYTKIV